MSAPTSPESDPSTSTDAVAPTAAISTQVDPAPTDPAERMEQGEESNRAFPERNRERPAAAENEVESRPRQLPFMLHQKTGRPVTPKPHGPLSGKRTAWRRAFSWINATINNAIDFLPPSRWIHRQVQRRLQIHDVPFDLRRGAVERLKIAFLSDIHAGSFMNSADLRRIFERVAAQEPDLVCLGGDLINTREREILLLRDALRAIDPPLGVFAVPGNHDHFYGRDIGLWKAFLEGEGVTVLDNAGQRIDTGGGSVWLCGVDDLTEGTPDLRAALDGRCDDEPTVLLTHHPDFFFEAAAADVDLTLAGHTHGGQILLCGWTPLDHSAFGYWRGMFEENDCRLYVGRGVGVTLLPLRVGADPEIPIFTLRSRTEPDSERG